jgi:uncharacterized protein
VLLVHAVITARTSWTVLPAAVAFLVLLVIVRFADMSAVDLGLARGTLRTGLLWAVAAIALAGVGYALLLFSPLDSALLDDARTPQTLSGLLVKVAVDIPRTVLVEEFAFRGVLWGLLTLLVGSRAATVWSSLAFGLWHVPPALGFVAANATASTVSDRSAAITTAVVAGTVIFTTAAGVLLCELRRRSGSLLAPMGLHWAANSGGTVAGYLAA